MKLNVQNVKVHGGKSVPFLRFDLHIDEVAGEPAVRLIGMRYMLNRLVPAQASLRNGTFWDHWSLRDDVERAVVELLQVDPVAWPHYQKLLVPSVGSGQTRSV